MSKPRSQSAAGRHPTSPTIIDQLADQLADQIADKPYGQKKAKAADSKKTVDPEQKAQAIGISLPPSMIEKLQDAALVNKRGGHGQKTVSGIIRELLEREGY
ncbi:hypothetical protein HK44_002130 [Pseudomonas fluorescens HK44]|uniref:Uncharacterized protein n=1 Tax=Pseudomonas fluorescens HK44 TaxID=1042209 RepID=A0A010S096_PSEFL|nr:hypothetical protein [Pseudomonas fluorescens]EXF94314.1 hypothetical protein HK44_002130 [Pseudomonas fluorescens HK44]